MTGAYFSHYIITLTLPGTSSDHIWSLPVTSGNFRLGTYHFRLGTYHFRLGTYHFRLGTGYFRSVPVTPDRLRFTSGLLLVHHQLTIIRWLLRWALHSTFLTAESLLVTSCWRQPCEWLQCGRQPWILLIITSLAEAARTFHPVWVTLTHQLHHLGEPTRLFYYHLRSYMIILLLF